MRAGSKKPTARRKPKGSSGTTLNSTVSWESSSRCTLSDLCAEDKKKVSNLISKVVALNNSNESLERELSTFRTESEKLRDENMHLHKLNSSLQTKLMQALVLTKTYQDQIKSKKTIFTIDAEVDRAGAPKLSQKTKDYFNPLIDLSNRREKEEKIRLQEKQQKKAFDISEDETLKKTTFKDRTLYFSSEAGNRVHAFDPKAATTTTSTRGDGPEETPKMQKDDTRKTTINPVASHEYEYSQTQAPTGPLLEEDYNYFEKRLEVDSDLEDIIDVINSSTAIPSKT